MTNEQVDFHGTSHIPRHAREEFRIKFEKNQQ
jgi:hypothetical protein